MTTIVGDWNNKIIVADSQFTDSDAGIKYFEDKIKEEQTKAANEKRVQDNLKIINATFENTAKQTEIVDEPAMVPAPVPPAILFT